MGTNACWIQLRIRRTITRARISEEIEAYWRAKGARVVARTHRPLEPHGLEQSKKLGYVIGGLDRGWVQVVDSERSTADFGLAKHLAASLETAVRFIGAKGGSRGHVERWLPSARTAPKRRPPAPSLLYADVEDEPELALAAIVFSRVRPDLYDAGPVLKTRNHIDAHQKIAEALDAKAARALLDAGSDIERCLTVFLGQAIDLNDAAARKFTVAIAGSALRHRLSVVRLVRIAEAAAREDAPKVLAAVRKKLTSPPKLLIGTVSSRLARTDKAAAERLRGLVTP